MVYAIHTCTLIGIDPSPVLCEVDLACQLPAFSLVGLPSSLTQESRDRIRAAVVNSKFEWPARKITVNLLPANLPKWGSHFELAMALGVLGAAAELRNGVETMAIGELSLSGEVRPCGWLAAVGEWIKFRSRQARLRGSGGLLRVIAHESDVTRLSQAYPELRESCELAGVRTLVEAVAELARPHSAENLAPVIELKAQTSHRGPSLARLAAVRDEPLGVVAALAAIAGGHHALFAGPHGMGKTMLARAICEALGPPAEREQAERAALMHGFGPAFSAQDEAQSGSRCIVPLQTSVTRAALEGSLLSTGQVLPGELTRAHHGVLLMDELLEFKRDVIEALRQPLDEGFVRLQRAKMRTLLPAKVQLLATTNLCPCGQWGKLPQTLCSCARGRRMSYQAKLSGPILDRFDLVVLVGQRNPKTRAEKIPADLEADLARLTNSASWSERLKQAAEILAAPVADHADGSDPIHLWGELSTDASDRGKLKMAKVSRTIAALLGEARSGRHLRLAALLRPNLSLELKELPDFSSHNLSGFKRLINT